MKCGVKNCENVYSVSSVLKEISFHSLRETENIEVQWKWKEFVEDSHERNPIICSQHFQEHDFVKPTNILTLAKYEKIKRELNSGAVPTIRHSSQESRHEDPRNSSNSACSPLRILPSGRLNVGSSKQVRDPLTTENRNLKREIQILKSENGNLKRKQTELFEHLSEVFSQNQLDLLLKRKEKISSWEDKELWEAFVLRSIGRRAFTFVRDTLKYPLPSKTEINEWALYNENRNFYLGEIISDEEEIENISPVERESENEIENQSEIEFEEEEVITAKKSTVKMQQKRDAVVENPEEINTEITFEMNEFSETENFKNTGDNEDDNQSQCQLQSEIKVENEEVQISEVVVKQEDLEITNIVSENKDSEDINTFGESDEDLQTDTESPVMMMDVDDDVSFKKMVRKRPRQPWLHKRNILKQKVEQGLERVAPSGKIIKAKKFEVQLKCCRNKCFDKIDPLMQERIFKEFYSMTATRKTLFLRESTKNHFILKHMDDNNMPIIPLKKVKKAYKYMLKNENGIEQKVCKNFFLTCLQISAGRIYYANETAIKNPNAVELRGKKSSVNKTPEHARNFAKDFIASIPAFESNHSREKSKKKYLKLGVTTGELYRQYAKLCQESNTTSVSKKIFADIFSSDYSFSFKQKKTDKCYKCDYYVKKKDSMSREDKQAYEEHMAYTQKVSAEFKEDVERSVNDETVKVLVFDLQLPLPTPKVPESEITFKKRQLWVFNLCVYEMKDNKGHMYFWSEDEGFKSGEEIASCLLTHIKNFVPESTKHLILYSDNCGGCPNRNMKITFLLKHMLANHSNLITIEQKFFVTGHGYSMCNHSFQAIDREARRHDLIAVPDQWMDIFQNAKKSDPHFNSIHMKTDDFFSTQELKNLLVNPKIKENGEKINWKKVHRLKYEKIHPTSITMTSFNGTSDKINIGKMSQVDFAEVELSLLYPAGRAITEAKKNDLKDLMQYIPQEYHEYYDSLIGDKDEIDFGLASGDDEDF
ncbi:hypothetical protein DMENIID0001_140830 [Sergentomyia squamirostris]